MRDGSRGREETMAESLGVLPVTVGSVAAGQRTFTPDQVSLIVGALGEP